MTITYCLLSYLIAVSHIVSYVILSFLATNHFSSAPSYSGPVPFPISASRHFGASVVGPHHAWPKPPHFGPIGYRNNFPF